jgi:hypothetical protein
LANGTQPPLPGWIGSAVQVTTQVGIPTVFAMVLLWYVLFKFEASMDKITARLEANAQSVQAFATIEAQQLGELQKQTKALEDMARQPPYRTQEFKLDDKELQ